MSTLLIYNDHNYYVFRSKRKYTNSFKDRFVFYAQFMLFLVLAMLITSQKLMKILFYVLY